MSKYWSETVKRIEPYVPGEQPRDRKYIKLNTNENPYPPSPNAIEAIKRSADETLRLYPDPECDDLREAIACDNGLRKEQVFVGNGSDEVLAFAFIAFFDRGREIVFPDITYTFYPVYAKLFNIKYRLLPLDPEFNIPYEGFFRENGGVIFPNPNAPTSKVLPLAAIEKVLQNNPDSVVIIDEAYIDFGGETSTGFIGRYPNLLIIRTLSKSHSLAGLRVGFALGNEELIEGLNRVKNSINSYTLDRIALAGAAAAITDRDYFLETRAKVIRTREYVVEKLNRMGFSVLDSKANFVFITHPGIPAELLFKKLRERGILVRYFAKPRIDNYLRVSIGSDEDMNCFLDALGEIIKT